ncbi:ABC transporter ATP-binding protein [Companilactobacillus jidongensis]|uniref:ABC transporter ATP-binding protein n=1 Tax=Companilactobacillus jidongensis TaxID=2486006 RepID=UPI000F7A668B|nr:ABC transporter ATP-binding protein [Companilactobacillus jidongensis]
MNNMSVITLNNVVKSFGKQTVLDHVNMQIYPGQIVGLIGPSGAGKSTVIKIVLGMELADSGRTTVFGKQMPNRELLGRIGYMAQSDALYESLSGRENLQFYSDMKGLNKRSAGMQINHVAQVVDLIPDLDKRVSGYSGGMKRRLSLAIALLGNNDVLILDEPTVGVDPALRRSIWTELKNLRNQGKTIMVTTHVMDEAELVDEVALLLGGSIIAYSDPYSLKQYYQVNSIEEVFLKAEAIYNTNNARKM